MSELYMRRCSRQRTSCQWMIRTSQASQKSEGKLKDLLKVVVENRSTDQLNKSEMLIRFIPVIYLSTVNNHFEVTINLVIHQHGPVDAVWFKEAIVRGKNCYLRSWCVSVHVGHRTVEVEYLDC